MRRLLLAVASGPLLALSFPPVGASILAPIAVALFTLACFGTSPLRGLGLGFVQGMATFLVLIRWMSLIGTDAWIALSAECAFWIALLGMGTAIVTGPAARRDRQPSETAAPPRLLTMWPLWVALLWVLEEALRDRIPWGGFAWGRLAFAQTATTLTPWAAVAGAPMVTFMTALAGTLLALLVVVILRERPRPSSRTVGFIVGGILLIGVSGLLVPLPTEGQSAGGVPEATGAVVQGGVPTTGLGENDDRRAVLDRHVSVTLALAEQVAAGDHPPPDFVIWPENASDLDPYVMADAADAISVATRAIDAPILAGAVIGVPGQPDYVANVGIVWDPETGPGESYTKVHPVPFGEYIPFRTQIASLIGRFDRIPRDFIAGTEPGILHVGPATVGDVICFEIAYDEVVRDAVVGGGRVIVVQTNNATFAGLGQPEQQVAMSRLRAVEHGRAVMVASTSGISVLIDPAGRVQQELGEGSVGSLVGQIALRDTLTLADRWGAWPEWLACAAVVGVMAWAIAWGRRQRASRVQSADPSA